MPIPIIAALLASGAGAGGAAAAGTGAAASGAGAAGAAMGAGAASGAAGAAGAAAPAVASTGAAAPAAAAKGGIMQGGGFLDKLITPNKLGGVTVPNKYTAQGFNDRAARAAIRKDTTNYFEKVKSKADAFGKDVQQARQDRQGEGEDDKEGYEHIAMGDVPQISPLATPGYDSASAQRLAMLVRGINPNG